jgi:hypothetical protein
MSQAVRSLLMLTGFELTKSRLTGGGTCLWRHRDRSFTCVASV